MVICGIVDLFVLRSGLFVYYVGVFRYLCSYGIDEVGSVVIFVICDMVRANIYKKIGFFYWYSNGVGK